MRSFHFSFNISESLLNHSSPGCTQNNNLEILLMNKSLSECFGTLMFSANEIQPSSKPPQPAVNNGVKTENQPPANQQNDVSINLSMKKSLDVEKAPTLPKVKPQKAVESIDSKLSSSDSLEKTDAYQNLANHSSVAWINAYANWYAAATAQKASGFPQPPKTATEVSSSAPPGYIYTTPSTASNSTSALTSTNGMSPTMVRKHSTHLTTPGSGKLTPEEKESKTCCVCSKTFRHLTNLGRHKRKKHCEQNNTVKPVKKFDILTPEERESLTCLFCNARFTVLSNLRRHKRSHNGCLFLCHLCNRTFTRPDNLRSHFCGKSEVSADLSSSNEMDKISDVQTDNDVLDYRTSAGKNNDSYGGNLEQLRNELDNNEDFKNISIERCSEEKTC